MKVKHSPRKAIYPCEPWTIREMGFDPQYNYRNETIFALGNGYLGTRGTFEEADDLPIDKGLEGNFVNGFYESETIRYGELTYGVPEHSQTMLNVSNAKEIRLFADGEALSMFRSRLDGYERLLDLKRALLHRTFCWKTQQGKELSVEITRMASFTRPHLLCISYKISAGQQPVHIRLDSAINGNVENHTRDTNPLIDYGPYGRVLSVQEMGVRDGAIWMLQKTEHTGLSLACVAQHVLEGSLVQAQTERESGKILTRFEGTLNAGESVCLTKYIAYGTSREFFAGHVCAETMQVAQQAARDGFAQLTQEQADYMAHFWERADVQIGGDDALQQGLRFNMFHILQSAGRSGLTGMPAKGLTGEGYEGHYFWDTEMYAMPFFSCTAPEISRALLDFRYHTLEQARERARVMGHPKGALYPWRTINGNEASTYYPQGTAQYHINADIAYALQQYLSLSGDIDYLEDKGAEMLIETARLWYDLGAFIPLRGGKFCISDVTGPDEYTSIVDNNFYTNLMARENLLAACQAVAYMRAQAPQKWQILTKKLALEPEEPELWKKAADNMYFPYDETLQVYGQDDTFLYKKPLDIEAIPQEKLPMLLHFHPLYVYRHRVAKQADLLMGMFLVSHKFTQEEKRRNYDFYETVTLHDSSLSTCIFSIMACDIGYAEDAYDYFTCTSRLDLDDYHGNVHTGIHAANMAGTWMGIVYGFAGMRYYDEQLHFRPRLPDQWENCRFRINYRGSLLEVSMEKGRTRFQLIQGTPVEVECDGEKVMVR